MKFQIFRYILAVTISAAVLPCHAKVAKSPSSDSVQKIFEKYKASPLVSMKVKKTTVSELVGKETVYSGEIYLSGKQFRWDNFTPEKSLILFDGKTLWSVQYPPVEFPGPVQIAKSANAKQIEKQSLVAMLLGREKLDKNFRIKDRKDTDKGSRFELEPLRKDMNVQQVVLEVDNKAQTIERVSYQDEIGNKTKLSFSDVVFNKSNNKKELFKFKIPSGAQVTDL